MKITESQLRRIVRQEAAAINEAQGGVVSTKSIRSLGKKISDDYRAAIEATEREFIERARQEMENLVPPGSKVRVVQAQSSRAPTTVGTVVEIQARMSTKHDFAHPEILIVVEYQTAKGRTSRRAFKLNELDPYTDGWFT